MCVIVIKEKGQAFPEMSMLEACFRDNPHGAGYMFARDGAVHIKKGYMDFGSFQQALEADQSSYNLDGENVVFHFRIASAGLINPASCHPFPVSNKVEEMQLLEVDCPLAFCHNGRLEAYVEGDAYSDTQHFGLEVLEPLYRRDPFFYKDENLKKMLEQLTGFQYSLCLLNGEGELARIGSFPTHNGYAVSNLHFSEEYRLQERERTEKYMHLDRIRVTEENATLADEIHREIFRTERKPGRWNLWAWKGEIVGISAYEHEEGNHQEAWLTSLGVRRPWRRQKVGSQILEEFMATCRWNGLEWGRLRTGMEATATVPFCLVNGMGAVLEGDQLVFSRKAADDGLVLQAVID